MKALVENANAGQIASYTKQSLRRQLLDAIRGTEADYTQIDLKKAIFLLAIPMILELVMESTFAVVDIYFVGKLGPSAVATVGLTETYLFLLYSLGIGLSMAITAIIARRIGEKNRAAAGVSAVQAILLALLFSLPFALAGIFFAKDLLALMGADAWSIRHGYRYTQWMLGGNAVIMLIFVINAIFRGAGDAAIAMRMLWLSNSINLLLDPLLIFGWGPFPAMGVEGAAIATTIGRGTGVALQLWILMKGSKHIRVRLADIRPDLKILRNMLRMSAGGIGQMLISTSSWIFLMRILADFGSAAVAGSTIALRIMMFTLMPAWGLSNAAATLVGQNLGAGRAKRAESAVWRIGTYNMIFLMAVSVIYYIFSDSLMGIFTQADNVVAIGSEWLKILSYSYFVYGWWMVAAQAFNGAGDTQTPTRINFFFFWLIQIPLAYLLAVSLDWQQSGVFWSVFFCETIAGLFTVWLFSRGGWKEATA